MVVVSSATLRSGRKTNNNDYSRIKENTKTILSTMSIRPSTLNIGCNRKGWDSTVRILYAVLFTLLWRNLNGTTNDIEIELLIK